MKSTRTPNLSAAALTAVVVLTGCHSIGPRTIAVDRSDYSQSMAESWKQQTLLNIVKLRYLDLPVFMNVSSVVAGYSLQTGISAGGSFPANGNEGGNTATFGGSALYTDRPTITYTPMTGQKFLHSLITPIEPKNIFFMIQSGYAADFILALTVESLNGLHNRSTAAGVMREADPAFIRVLQLLREVQAAGAFHMRVLENTDKTETAEVFFKGDNPSPEIQDKCSEIRRLLKVPEGESQFKLVYSSAAGGPGELGVGSRSMLQIMAAMAAYTEVPEADLKEGTALSVPESRENASAGDPVRIKCSPEKPVHAYAVVHYRDQWFWVDDRDWRTKRAFTAILFFFTITEDTGGQQLPLVTIPAQ